MAKIQPESIALRKVVPLVGSTFSTRMMQLPLAALLSAAVLSILIIHINCDAYSKSFIRTYTMPAGVYKA